MERREYEENPQFPSFDRYPRTRRDFEDAAIFGYTAAFAALVTAAWLTAHYIPLDAWRSGISGRRSGLQALIEFAWVVVALGGAMWLGPHTYLKALPHVMARARNHNTVLGTIIGSALGLSVTVILMLAALILAAMWATIIAAFYIIGFFVMVAIASAFTRD